ncbi:hypothetical protein [Methanolapillus millepedarum]|uniref:Uncharacterized protein n=1 Tax=Methanolapillus millepedarum TaxID=3028296 RepID=A0AA96ZVU6_9EURY|nr:hypothetical protein MsAc7_14150 [Methanosarcinaceae archaeon Ac7]
MMAIQYEYVFILMATLPGIYLAARENFIYTENKKYNLFIIRLLFTIPLFFIANVLISMIFARIFISLFPKISSYFEGLVGNYAVVLVPFIFSLILIILLKIYIVPPRDLKINYLEEIIDKDFDLYVFHPNEVMPDGRTMGTRFDIANKKRKEDQLPIRSQLTDLAADFRYLEGEYLMMTTHGEIVVSNQALEILKENGISGFYTRPVKKDESYRVFSKADPADNFKYKQLVCNHFMPKMSPPTEIVTKKYPLKVLVSGDIYYNQQILSEISDFNQTSEYFGSEYGDPVFVQRFWILTKKARDIFIERFDQTEDDFSPVHLVDEDGNVIENQLSDVSEMAQVNEN